VADFEDDLRPRSSFAPSDPTAVALSDVHKTYRVRGNEVQALKGVDLDVFRGEILGVVGESGSGKSTILRQVCGMETPEVGEVRLDGKYQYIFQDAYASFDPRMTIRQSLYESIRNAARRDGKPSQRGSRVPEYDKRIESYLSQVGLSPELLDRFPSRLSGGQCQRMAIARAMAVEPEILLCDEITSALDVSSQAQILHLLAGICRESHTSAIFVSHDLAVIRCLCDRVMIMRDGALVEEGQAAQVICQPKEAYTKKLVDSVMEIKN
jgi:peptide/nickel transport system ATP-binding protein